MVTTPPYMVTTPPYMVTTPPCMVTTPPYMVTTPPYRYRLITGDQCVMTVETADLIKQVERPCTAHELEAGFFTVVSY